MPKPWLALTHLRQETILTCTPACIRMVLAYSGHNEEEATLAQLLETEADGTRFSQISNVEALGFDVTVGPGSYRDVLEAFANDLPVTVPVRGWLLGTHAVGEYSDHCVVVAGGTRGKVAIYDPGRLKAPEVIPVKAFEAAWAVKGNRMAVLKPT